MASAGASATRVQHSRHSSASLAVIPAERFALLSQPSSLANSAVSSPVTARADTSAANAEGAASPSAPPPARSAQAQTAAETVPVPTTGGSECAAQPGRTREPLTSAAVAARTTDGVCAAASQAGSGAASEPSTRAAVSNPPSSYGLSLQQLQHLVALTNANDSPRDAAAAFPYAATSDGRSRLSINSAQRRLDSWNRAREPVVENTVEQIRARRKLKRSGSDPSLRRSARGGEDSLGGPSRPLEGVVSEARRIAMRRWLRRSRSAHTLGEKDTAMLWNEAMKAIIWGRGGAVVFRRPAGGSSQARPSGGERLGNGSTQSSGAGNAARYNSAYASGITFRVAHGGINGGLVQIASRSSSPSLSRSASATASPASSSPSPSAAAAAAAEVAAAAAGARYMSAGDPRVFPSEKLCRIQISGAVPSRTEDQSRVQQQHQLQLQQQRQRQWQQHRYQQQLLLQRQRQAARDPVKSVFAWAAEQRMAARRADRAQP